MAGVDLRARPAGDRRAKTWRASLEHLAVELINATTVALVAVIAAGAARALLWIAR